MNRTAITALAAVLALATGACGPAPEAGPSARGSNVNGGSGEVLASFTVTVENATDAPVKFAFHYWDSTNEEQGSPHYATSPFLGNGESHSTTWERKNLVVCSGGIGEYQLPGFQIRWPEGSACWGKCYGEEQMITEGAPARYDPAGHGPIISCPGAGVTPAGLVISMTGFEDSRPVLNFAWSY